MTAGTIRPGMQQELSELAAALAHEIKNPAALALAHVAQLRRRADLHGIGDTCDHIEEALEEICCLVQEMLFVAYGAAPAYEFDLEDMLLDILEAFRAAWPQICFTLDVAPQAKGLMYYGEETYIKMIFTNLLKNAVEAVGAAGEVDIMMWLTEDGISISIKDSGCSNSNLKPHASGLGLAICRWLLGRAGGRMELGPAETPQDSGALADVAVRGCMARVMLPIC